MKKCLILLLITLLILTGCTSKNKTESNTTTTTTSTKSLVLYFSVTNNTENIAKYIQELTSSDITEIIPKEAYTDEDIDYNTDDCRANQEQNSETSRPKISNKLNLEEYNTIYLGYPIWWGKEPKIILTLLDNYNLEGKTIIPFCTSASSGIETSVSNLRTYNSKLTIQDGKRFSSNSTKEEVKEWLSTKE